MMNPIEIALRQVVETIHILVEKGIFKGTAGNFSVRVAGMPAFAITPSSIDYGKISEAEICVLNWELKSLAGAAKPSIESGMHAAVYQARPDVGAVLHTHQEVASALALIDAAIPALFDEQVRYLGRSVEVIPYRPSGTSLLQNAVKARVKNQHNAYILKNHGVLILGSDPERAVHNAELLEKCATAYLLALCTERKVTKIPLAVREIAFEKLRAEEKKAARQGKNP